MVMVVGLVGEVFKFPPVESDTLTFQFRVVEVFEALAQDRRQQLHPRTRLVLRMSFYSVFRTFPNPKESAKLGPHSGSELSADFTPSTPAAYEDSDGPPMWYGEDGNAWWESSAGRWYLLSSGRTVWWDAPG